MSPEFRFLDEAQRQTLATAAFELLARVGVRVTEREALALRHGAGAWIDGERVRLPAPMLEAALRSAPPAIDLFRRDGRLASRLGGHAAHLGAHTDAPAVLDPFGGRRRPCLEADVVRHARLVDALPEMAFVTASGLVADRPAELGDRVSLACCLEGSARPVLSMPVTLPFERRLNERTRELLNRPAATLLPEATVRDMRAVISRAEARLSR